MSKIKTYRPNFVFELYLVFALNSVLVYDIVINFNQDSLSKTIGLAVFVQVLIYLLCKNRRNEFTIDGNILMVENRWRFTKKEQFDINTFFKCYSIDSARTNTVVMVLKDGGDIEFNTGALSTKTKASLIEELNKRINNGK